MADKRKPASRRVSWPEPGHQNGGEFRLTWARIAAIVGVLAALVGAVPTFWALSDHWMNRAEIKEAQAVEKTRVDAALKAHSDHDAGVQQWNQYGFAANRVEYLDDKQAECEAKKMTQMKLAPSDAAMCARFEAKLRAKTQEAAELKAKALEAGREK